ncbi:MAG: zinc-ribbon domain-containing protein [Clostridia bacterium]|nr:zinc-ribbon domain-containing protein [Clostridia bacterium]
MFCKNCGKDIDDSAVVCPNCGVATDNMAKNTTPAPAQKNSMALAGFILALLGFNLIALILSIVGLSNSKKPEYAGDGKGFAIAGIVIACIYIGLFIILGISCSAVGCAALGAAGAY